MPPPDPRKLISPLTLEAASTIVDTALAAGRAAGFLPLTVVVLDAGGHVVALKREDGSGVLRVEIATAKAYGAIGMGLPSRDIGERLGGNPAFQSAIAAASGGRFASVPGGVLIKDGSGAVIGAVGISGDTSHRDEYCAIQGITAAALTPDPSDPDPKWESGGH